MHSSGIAEAELKSTSKTSQVMSEFDTLFSPGARRRIRLAIREDVGRGDVTARLLVPPATQSQASILARKSGVFCGGPVLAEVFRLIDPALEVRVLLREGRPLRAGQAVVRLSGSRRSMLAGERVALNFLGLLSGIATRTRQFVERVKKDNVLILDTRKTLPLLREFQKYAVRVGGGKNHRMGLYDAIFVKENHRLDENLEKLVQYRHRFEIEVRNLDELRQALDLDPRVILLDNFPPVRLRKAVELARSRRPGVILEASGGITLENVCHYAAMGVDWISIGALTHSVENMDFSMLVKERKHG